jgi:hypothetical protein
MDGTHWEDDRVARRDLAGGLVGGLAGFALVALVSTTWIAPGERWPLLLALAGAAIGALVGRLLARTITPDEIEPHASNRPFVGTRAPDDDSALPEPPPVGRI